MGINPKQPDYCYLASNTFSFLMTDDVKIEGNTRWVKNITPIITLIKENIINDFALAGRFQR